MLAQTTLVLSTPRVNAKLPSPLKVFDDDKGSFRNSILIKSNLVDIFSYTNRLFISYIFYLNEEVLSIKGLKSTSDKKIH